MKSLKLNSLKKDSLTRENLENVLGCAPGDMCICGCCGSSSTMSNGCANKKGGLYSPGGGLDFTEFNGCK